MRHQILLLSSLFALPLTRSVQKKATFKEKPYTFHPANSWKDPKTILSCPPPLTVKQMGVIETLGIQPLGYKKRVM